MAIVHGDIAGAEPSTVTFKVDTVTIDQNSTVCHREVHVIGDPQSSNAYAVVKATPPVSTEFGQVVRIASGPSSAVDLSMRPVFSSTGADNPVSVSAFPANSSLVQLNAIAAGYVSTATPAAGSSGLNVWVVGGNGISTIVSVAAMPANSSQVEVRALPANSSQVQLNAIAAGYVSTSTPAAGSSGLNVWVVGGNGVSTTVSVAAFPANSSQVEVRTMPANSSKVEVTALPAVTLGTNLQSTVAPSSGSSGLIVRQVWDDRATTASTNAFASTSLSIVSSVAGVKTYVTAYTITSTVAAATKIAFYDGASVIWPVVLQAVSSAIAGANLSAYPYLFHGSAANALTLQTPSSVAGFKVAVSYYRAP